MPKEDCAATPLWRDKVDGKWRPDRKAAKQLCISCRPLPFASCCLESQCWGWGSRQGKFIFVWERYAGQWLITADMGDSTDAAPRNP